MNRREWLRISGVIGGALASSIASALDKPGGVPLMILKGSDPAESEKINNIFAAAGLTAGDDPGAAVLVTNNGGVLFQRGYGVVVRFANDNFAQDDRAWRRFK